MVLRRKNTCFFVISLKVMLYYNTNLLFSHFYLPEGSRTLLEMRKDATGLPTECLPTPVNIKNNIKNKLDSTKF